MSTIRTRIAFPILVIATILGLGYVAYVEGQGYDCPDGTVVVEVGDTLWSIAEENCEGEIRHIIYDMRELNPHIGDTLQPGDVIRLPS